MSNQWEEIGNRLRAYRIGKNLTANHTAERIGVSRAALYRLEKGELIKIETLEKVAELLEVSLPSLMGVGVEYYSNAVAFFERLRQLEENVVQILGNFTPTSFVLMSHEYMDHLRVMLLESVAPDSPHYKDYTDFVERALSILQERRNNAIKKRSTLVSVVNAKTIERFLHSGLIGRYDLSADILRQRRALARKEIERLIDVFRKQPIGTQMGVVEHFSSEQTFQILEKYESTYVTISPYRLGDHPNISAGVAMVTSAPGAVTMFKEIISNQWEVALKGESGARLIEDLLSRAPS
jgi:transcriptional regulator with XRE-family HTH domain